MPYWCAAFGPSDSYLFNSPRKWSMCGLPDRVNSLFTIEPKAREIHEIALGPNGSYAIIFSDATGIKVRHSGLPAAMEEWLLSHSKRAINSARDLATMQITLGPNGSYFAFDKTGCTWGGLPPALDAAVNERRDGTGCFKPGAYPYLVSLGAAGTYTMFTVGGGGTWYFGGQKPELDQYLNGLGNLMHVGVILSPFDVKHYLLVTGQGVTAGFCPDVCAAAYEAFAADWRSSIQGEMPPPPPPPPGPPTQTELPPQLPPRRPSSVAEDAQTRHGYIPYTPSNEHRPSLPPRPFSDTTPAYTAHAAPPAQTSPQHPPPPSPTPIAASPPTQTAPSFPSPPVQRRPVKPETNPTNLSPPTPREQTPHSPGPPPYSPNPAAATTPTDIKTRQPLQPAPAPAPTPAQTAQTAQARAAAAKAKRNQRIATGLKVGKMAMQGLAIGAALVNIASGNGGDIPSFDTGGGDVPLPDMQVPDTSAYWQPLQDAASMPIQ